MDWVYFGEPPRSVRVVIHYLCVSCAPTVLERRFLEPQAVRFLCRRVKSLKSLARKSEITGSQPTRSIWAFA